MIYTGPKYVDCSALLWNVDPGMQADKYLHIYTGFKYVEYMNEIEHTDIFIEVILY